MKKILALVLALLVALSMTAAFAEGATLPVGVAPTSGEYDGTTFKSVLKTSVTAPGTQFVYSISNGDGLAATEEQPAIKAGTGNVVFATSQAEGVTVVDGKATVTFASGTGEREVNVALSFTGDDPAGIYRYIITQEAYGTGMVDAGFKTEDNGNGAAISYYMDVYKDASKVYAVILSKVAGDNMAENGKKVDSFVNLYSYSDNTTEPESYDVTISKTLGNGGAEDTAQAFPFHISVKVPYTENTVDTNGMSFDIEGGTADNFGTTVAAGANGAAVVIEGTLTGGASIKIKGLPAGTEVKVYESTPAGDAYKISSKVTGMNSDSTIGVYDNPNNSTIATESSFTTMGNVIGNTATDGVIDYLNYRRNISPTGIVLRFAPYIAMMIAGLALLIVARKRRSHKNED